MALHQLLLALVLVFLVKQATPFSVLSFKRTSSSVSESTASTSITIERNTTIGDLNYTINRTGAAVNGTDYTFVQEDFKNGSNTTTIVVTIINNLVINADKTLIITLEPGVPGVAYSVNQGMKVHTLTIMNDDNEIYFCHSQKTTVKEDAGSFDVELCRRGAITSSSTLKLTIVGDSNSNPAISSTTKNVTFPSMKDKITENVTVTNDTIGENETSSFSVTIGPSYDPSAMIINQTTLNVTLMDDDNEFFFPGLRVKTVNEDSGPLNVTIERKGATSVQASVTINFTSHEDCTGQSDPNITFGANVKTKNVTLCNVFDDEQVEPEETFTIELQGVGGSVVTDSKKNMTLKITSNDASFSCLGASVTESSGEAVVNVTRSGDTSFAVDIRCFTKDNTAKQAVDYVPTGSLLPFPIGVKSKPYKVELADNDKSVETNKTFNVTCFTTTSGFDNRLKINASCTNAQVVIVNDDTEIYFCDSQKTMVKEDAGLFGVELCRRGVITSSSTIKLTIVGDSNSNPAISPTTKNVTFPSNQDKITESVTVTNDTIGENETSSFSVTIGPSYDPSAMIINQTTLKVTLMDDDIEFYFPGWRVKTVNEDVGPLNVTIQRKGVLSVPANVTINFTSHADCIGASNPTITFEANVTTKEVTLCNVTDDKLVELDETFTIELQGVDGSVVTDSKKSMTLTIKSNDVNITCSKATIIEDLGTVDMGMTRSGATNTSNVIRCFTKPDSAIKTSDYTRKDKNIIFPSGSTSSKLSINITKDDKVEGNETLKVSCNTTDDRVNLISCTDVPIIIINDDTYIFFCSPYKKYIREAGGPYTVALCRVGVMAAYRSVMLCWTSDANGLRHDYPSISKNCTSISFSPYEKRKEYNIAINNDTWGEEEFRKFNISIQNNDARVTFNGTTRYLVTLHDEDNSFCTTKQYTFHEQTDQYVNITIKRWGAITTTSASVRVKIQQNNPKTKEDAQTPDDYEAPDEKVFTFLINETEKTVTIKIKDDKVTEDDQTFQLLLFGVNGSTVFPQCRTSPVTIVSNDVNIFCNDLNLGTQSVFENRGPVTITFVREGSIQYKHTIRVKTVAGTAKPGNDFVALNDTELTFNPNQTQIQQNIILVNDLIVEPDETFHIDVSSNDGRVNRMCPGIYYVIKNDDTFIGCANSSISVNEESKTVYFVLKREGYLNKMARVWYKTVDGSAYDKSDYKPVNKTYTNFKTGQVFMTLSVDIVNDDVDENTENFAIMIGSDDPTIVTASSCTTMTIKDDDEKRISAKQAQAIEEQRKNAIILLALAVGILACLSIVVIIVICVVCKVVF